MPTDVPPEGKQRFLADGRVRPKPKKRNNAVPDRYQQLIDGVISIDDLDDEEISRGRLRNANGNFSGPAPKVIPTVLHTALRDAMNRRTERRLLASMDDMTDALVKIAVNKYASSEARVRAIGMAMDRGLGKVVDRQEISTTVTAKWEQAAESGRLFVDLDPEPDIPALESGGLQVDLDEPDDDIVEAEIVIEPEKPPAKPRTRTGVRL